MENIPEYLSLCSSTATINNNYYTWTIPFSYYSQNNRGPICYLSLSDCNIYVDYEGGIIIKYENGAQNVICSENSGGSYLGNVQLTAGDNKTYFHTYNNPERIKLLTQAKPIQITISTWTVDGTAQAIDDALFVLKFEYYNQEEISKNYNDTFYKIMN